MTIELPTIEPWMLWTGIERKPHMLDIIIAIIVCLACYWLGRRSVRRSAPEPPTPLRRPPVGYVPRPSQREMELLAQGFTLGEIRRGTKPPPPPDRDGRTQAGADVALPPKIL